MGDPLNSMSRSLARGSSLTITSGLRIMFITHSGDLLWRIFMGAGPINLESGLWQATHIMSKVSFPFTANLRSISGSSVIEVIGPTPLFSTSIRCEAVTGGFGASWVVVGWFEDVSVVDLSIPHARINASAAHFNSVFMVEMF